MSNVSVTPVQHYQAFVQLENDEIFALLKLLQQPMPVVVTPVESLMLAELESKINAAVVAFEPPQQN